MPEQAQAPKASNQKLIIIIGAIIIALLVTVIVVLLVRPASQQPIADGDTPRVGYAPGARVMLDENALQAAVDQAQANARDGRVALQYKNNAYSKDGKTFSCHIINSARNKYDMFLTMFADAELTDQIFLSGLVPPGSGFDEITLEHELEVGNHTVYVVLTQVDDDENGVQYIKHQITHTMVFHVS